MDYIRWVQENPEDAEQMIVDFFKFYGWEYLPESQLIPNEIPKNSNKNNKRFLPIDSSGDEKPKPGDAGPATIPFYVEPEYPNPFIEEIRRDNRYDKW